MALKNMISDGVATISHDSEVKKAEAAIRKHSHQGITEDPFCEVMVGLSPGEYEATTENVTESMGLNEENKECVLDAWQDVKFGGATTAMVKQPPKTVGGFKFVSVFLAATEKPDGTYDLVCSTHNLKLGVSKL